MMISHVRYTFNHKNQFKSQSKIIMDLNIQVYGQSYSGLDKSETDSGCHLQDQDSDDLVSELQMRLADMEKELRVVREQNKS